MNYKATEFIRGLLKILPLYKKMGKILCEPFSPVLLNEKVKEAIKNVPYYISNDYNSLLEDDDIVESLSRFPILSKNDLLGHEREFVSQKTCKHLLRQQKTGGSTGKTMKLYYSPTITITHDVYPDILMKKYAGKPMRIAMLRGQKPNNDKFSQRISSQRLLLSSYKINANNINKYIDILKREKITCLMAFPSSIVVMAKLIKDKFGSIELPNLKLIFTSSEVFSKEDKILVMEVFKNTSLVDFYCMTEFVAAGYSVGLGHYEFCDNYGFVELIDTGNKTEAGNSIARIVATSIMNTTMPLIRYDTGDLAEIDNLGNVMSIIGRVNHYAIDKNNQQTPCIVIFSKEPVMKVLQYQYYQDSPGVLEVRVLPKESFNEADRMVMINDMKTCFGDRMDCRVSIVEKVEYTPAGKLNRMIQKLDLSAY